MWKSVALSRTQLSTAKYVCVPERKERVNDNVRFATLDYQARTPQ